MRIFLDSSALAKRYLHEVGTEAVVTHCHQATEILLSVIAVPELISALNRLRRERRLSAREYRKLKAAFAADLESATVIDISDRVVREAIRCLEAYPLRTLDALQIGSAVIAHGELFVSADRQQIRAARRLSLAVAGC